MTGFDLDQLAAGLELGRRAPPFTVASGAPIPASTSFHFVWSCGTDARSVFVYGWTGFPNTSSVAPISTRLPRRRIIVLSLM